FFSSRRRHTRFSRDWSSDVCSSDLGRHVRYEPAARVAHTARLRPTDWARRRHEYGTSAADLARRHPGRLAPARPSAWNLTVLGLLARGRPAAAAACAGVSAALLARRLSRLPSGASLAASIVARGAAADAAALGHALRREWWPLRSEEHTSELQ